MRCRGLEKNRLNLSISYRTLRKQGDQLYFSIPSVYKEDASVDYGVFVVVEMKRKGTWPIQFTKRIIDIGGRFGVFIPKDVVDQYKLVAGQKFDIDLELIF